MAKKQISKCSKNLFNLSDDAFDAIAAVFLIAIVVSGLTYYLHIV